MMQPDIRVQKSLIDGLGTFAKKSFKKGEEILKTEGILVDDAILDQQIVPEFLEVCFQIDKENHLCPRDKKELNGIFLVNHSCNPNCGIKERINLVAMCDIAKGEEITFDYCMTDANFAGLKCRPTPTFKCLCKCKNCRKYISGEDWKNPVLQNKYKGYFSEYIENLVSSSKKG